MSSSAIDPSTVEIGQSIPPHGPHTITMHLPGWKVAERFRNRDMSVFTLLKSIYPRFSPFGLTAALCGSIAQRLSLPEGYGCFAFLSGGALLSNHAYAVSAFRKENRLDASDLRYYVAEIDGVRFYVVGFPLAKAGGAMFQWQNGGLGFSSRLAESLLPYADSMVNMGEFPGGIDVPKPTFLPETDNHTALKKRIASLMMRACASEHEKAVQADDVFLYQTGMAAICRLHEAISTLRAGPTVVFGAVFHSTFQIFEERVGGIKHYGLADDASVDDFEMHLAGGGECSFVFTEFPSNPILVSVDLMRLRRLADKYNFFLVVDDTCGSFANIDLLSAADIVLTSLTKSFSGYADVMGGSVVVNPNSVRAYPVLKQAISSSFHNELFDADAACLLSNNSDYFTRCAIYNRNASTLASYFHSLSLGATSPVKRVWYPPYSPGSNYLKEFLRTPTADYPFPGYGCLLSIEFENIEQTAAFLNTVNFFQGPHLGAHLTLAMPYNFIVYGNENPEVHAAYGLVQHQVRISVGLEDQEVLLQRCAEALNGITKTAAA
ncbi:cystathionine gamma-synthase [Xylaria nigripes]|nr:cystathionine gamma-synthase [Xylaria nigripes]